MEKVYHNFTYKSTRLPFLLIDRTLGPLVAFLRLFPLFIGLYCRFYLLQAKVLLDPRIVSGGLPEGQKDPGPFLYKDPGSFTTYSHSIVAGGLLVMS